MAKKKQQAQEAEQQDFFKKNLALQEKVKELTNSLNSYKSANTRLVNLRKGDKKIFDEKAKQLCEAIKQLEQEKKNEEAKVANLANDIVRIQQENRRLEDVVNLQTKQKGRNEMRIMQLESTTNELKNQMQHFNKLPWYKKIRYKF